MLFMWFDVLFARFLFITSDVVRGRFGCRLSSYAPAVKRAGSSTPPRPLTSAAAPRPCPARR